MASVPFNNLITFSRGSNATLTGANGLIQYAPNNLLTFSEQFDNAAWTKAGMTVTANSTTAPDGTATADTLTATAGTGVSVRVSQSGTTINATVYTASFYVRPGTHTFVQIHINAQTADWVNFTLTGSGSVQNNGAAVGAISYNSVTGYYRISATYTAGSTDRTPFFGLVPSGTATRNQTWNPAGTETVFIWGAQFELGSAATTYNSTTVKNLLGFSEAFDNAAWTKTNSSIVTGAQANPVNGAFNAQKLMENTAAGIHYTTQSITALSPASRTFMVSAYCKAAERGFVTVGLSDISIGSRYAVAVFNLSTGAVATTGASDTGYSVVSASAVSVGNGWYRCSALCAVGASAPFLTAAIGVNQTGIISVGAGGMQNYTGDGNSGIYIYGAQLSDSASLDPYVPTPAAAPSSTAYYGPRFDYDPVTLAPKGLLVEEARTNLMTGSADFTATYWPVATNAVVTADNTTSPDGTNNADRLADNTTAGVQHRIYRDYTFTAASHTLSVFAKRNDHRWLRLFFFDGTTSFFGNFDLLNGVVGNKQASTTTTITAFGNGWYRCTMTATTAAAAGNIQLVMLPTDDTAVPVLYTGTGTSLWLYGAQLEAGAFATSYIPTVASTVTRSADVATISGSLFSQWYAQSEGTLLCAFIPTTLNASGLTTYTATGISDGTSNNYNVLYVYSDFAGGAIRTGAVNQADLNAGGSPANNTPIKSGIAYATNNIAVTANGTVVKTDTSATINTTMTNLGVGNRALGNPINGHIRSIDFIPARAADFQLQTLTV